MIQPETQEGFNSFSLFHQYYDLLYPDKDYLKETQYILSIIKKHGTVVSELLELGFGTGNHAKHFSDAGFNITGIEKSGEMVAVAKAKSIPRFAPLAGDITTFSLDKKFDMVVALFHVMSYLTENAAIQSCFKKVSEHLNDNGLFVFDVWYTSAVFSQSPETRVKKVDAGSLELIRIAEPTVLYDENVIQVDYTLIADNRLSVDHKIMKETHRMRHFSTPEIKLLAELSGLTVVHAEEFLTGKTPSSETWGVCYILRKHDGAYSRK